MKPSDVMKLALRLLSVVGVVLFGLLLALTFLSPIHVERAARTFIQSEIERKLSAELAIAGGLSRDTRVGRLAGALAERHAGEIAQLRGRLASGLHTQIATVVGRMQSLDCACRQRLRQGLDAAAQSRISRLERAEPQVRQLIEGNYAAIVVDLLHDLRIFAGTNLLAFLLLLILSIVKADRVRQLLVPAILLGAATLTASAFYLFGQNWFFTLLYADYFGWTYGLWLLVIFGLFVDIAMFKARVTTPIVDAVLSVLGKGPIPC